MKQAVHMALKKNGVGLNSCGWIDWWSFISHHLGPELSTFWEVDLTFLVCSICVCIGTVEQLCLGVLGPGEWQDGPTSASSIPELAAHHWIDGAETLYPASQKSLSILVKVHEHSEKLSNFTVKCQPIKVQPYSQKRVLVFMDLCLLLGEPGVIGVRSGPGEQTKGDRDRSHTYRSTSM